MSNQIRREKMLVLGISEPYRSKKYDVAVCVAGITYGGEFRRIYSIPMRYYRLHPFKKHQYISYEITGNKGGDGRPESRKINPKSIRTHNSLSSQTISKKIDANKQCLDYLQDRSRITLGIVKPQNIRIELDERKYPRTLKYSRVRASKKSIKILPFWVKIKFKCRKRGCRGHNILCEDIEIGDYYRRLLKRMKKKESKSKVVKRVQQFLNKVIPYLLMGTHRRYKDRWLIISLLNKKALHFYAYRKRE